MLKILILLPLVGTVLANDIRLGYAAPQAKLIYAEVRERAPALWRRSEEITVTTTGNEVISAIYITDLRELKDGVAEIVEGGAGAKSVTISLKSPVIFRGYKFEVEVYANDPKNNERYYNKGGWGDWNDGYFRNSQGQVVQAGAGTGQHRSPQVNDGYNVQGYDNSQYGRKN